MTKWLKEFLFRYTVSPVFTVLEEGKHNISLKAHAVHLPNCCFIGRIAVNTLLDERGSSAGRVLANHRFNSCTTPNQAWEFISLTPELGIKRQENQKSKVILSYTFRLGCMRPCLKNKNRTQKQQQQKSLYLKPLSCPSLGPFGVVQTNMPMCFQVNLLKNETKESNS